MRTLKVNLPGREYNIHIGRGNLKESLIDAVHSLKPELVVSVTNTTLEKLYPHRIQKFLIQKAIRVEECVLPDGENYKNIETLNLLYDFLMNHQANRYTLLIAFGGGVIGDMAGFAAATFMRGIPLIQVPTTLLAQVDSSVGGKTAVNHLKGKNIIGAFKQPCHVSIDLDFLKTLPLREFRAGYFEIAKHALIHNLELFKILENNTLEPLNLEFIEEVVFRSCQIKSRIVGKDETESGIRATLNFGHTLGHLIETHSGYTEYLHGEAVGVGMLFAAFLSFEEKYLRKPDWLAIRDFLLPILINVRLTYLPKETFQELLLHDKKSTNQSVNFILLRGIGRCFIHQEMSLELIWKTFSNFVKEFPEVCRLDTLGS